MTKFYNLLYSLKAPKTNPFKKSYHVKLVFIVLIFLMAAQSLKAQFKSAENLQFPFRTPVTIPLNGPAGCTETTVPTRIFDVTKAPYSADKTGKNDCTAAFRAILSQAGNASGSSFVYVPNGTYKFTDSVGFSPEYFENFNGRWGTGARNIFLWGESRSGVTLKLASGSKAFQNINAPHPFFHTGSGSADRIGNSVANLTIEIESGNPGAIGLRYYGNNYGGLYNVTIKALGKSKIGLDKSYSRANGPTLTKDVLIEGFEIGLKTDYSVESEVYEHLTLRNQTRYGVYNGKQILTIRDLKVLNCGGPAFVNEAGFVNLIDCDFRGAGGGAVAVQNGAIGKLLACNLKTANYTRSIADPQNPYNKGNTTIAQYLSDAAIGRDGKPNPKAKPLNLPVKETPIIPWDDPSTWVDPVEFGAQPSGKCGDKGLTTNPCRPCADDSEALQRAIDATLPGGSREGATTLFISGSYRIYKTVFLRGSIRRVIGKGFDPVAAPYDGTEDGTKRVQTTWEVQRSKNSPQELEIINIGVIAGHNIPYLKSTCGRTIILKNSDLSASVDITNGEVFIESCATGGMKFTNAKVWARQLNCEGAGVTKVEVSGGSLWCLGFKSEQTGTGFLATGGSKVEVYGAYLYSTHGSESSTMVSTENSDISASIFEYTGRWGAPFGTLVKDVKSGKPPVTLVRATNNTLNYPSTWGQCNDGTTPGECNTPIGSSFLLYTNK